GPSRDRPQSQPEAIRLYKSMGGAPITLLCARLGCHAARPLAMVPRSAYTAAAGLRWLDRLGQGWQDRRVSAALRELLIRHVDVGTIPGGVALLGAGNVELVTAGVASVGGGAMGEDAIMRIQSMTKAITSVAALRLVEAGRLELDQSLADWLPELADRQVLRR